MNIMRLLGSGNLSRAVVGTAALSLALLSAIGNAAGNHTARRENLSRKPMWVFSGAWAADGSLLLVDGGRKEVDRFLPNGRFKGKVGSADVFTRPSLLNGLEGGGFLLENQNGSLVRLSEDLRRIDSFNVVEKTKGQPVEISALYRWVPLGCGPKEPCEILTYADIHYPADDHWMSAFLRVPLAEPKSFKILLELPVTDPVRNHYLIGSPFVAALDRDSAFLLMRENPILYYASPAMDRAQPLARMARTVARRAEIPDEVAFSNVQVIFDRLEQAPNTAGLYGADGHLYLLDRQPAESGTKWTITKLETNAKVAYTLKLPTEANNLTVIPGPNEWAFIEKGPVLGMFQQEISSVLFVRTADIENFR
jgi:hypothetical protein